MILMRPISCQMGPLYWQQNSAHFDRVTILRDGVIFMLEKTADFHRVNILSDGVILLPE